MNILSKGIKLNKFLLMFAIGLTLVGNIALASDNVLQAIQVDGVKDSYNIILKSDDVAELKKTIQAPNKMIINLKGVRASKTINTIYNNTASVDSVVVEPTGEDSVKILVQADNVANAGVHFDALKTPLGVLDNSPSAKKAGEEITLSSPMQSYKPVYHEDEGVEEGISLSGSSLVGYTKKALKSDKMTLFVALSMIGMFVLAGIKTVKGKDSEIKVGLSQGLRQTDSGLLQENLNIALNPELGLGGVSSLSGLQRQPSANITGVNYGIRAYQNGTRSPYMSSEVQQRPRVQVPTPAPSPMVHKPTAKTMAAVGARAGVSQPAGLKPQPQQKTTTSIDSMKFLESMTKIYEKNGRSDLAQGLKANMKKAKVGMI